MTINEYVELKNKQFNVWCDLNFYIMGENLKYHDDIKDLMFNASKVICAYESFVSRVFDKIQIEDCITNKQ